MSELSYVAAFIGGMLTLLPACGPALLPAFFGFSFKEKSSLARATLVFALGFSVIFIPLGFGLRSLVNIVLESRHLVFVIAGWLMIVFGIISLFGGSTPRLKKNPSNIGSIRNQFLLGIVFGFTSGACSAPIFGAILTLASGQGSAWQSLSLLVVFELGMFIFLFFLALAIDRFNLMNKGWFRGSGLVLHFRGKELRFYATNILSAIIFIALGALYILNDGATPLTRFAERAGLIDWTYNINIKLIQISNNIWAIALFCLLIIVALIMVKLLKRPKIKDNITLDKI
jgi:cytochrome c biogenesis protein CcdA